MGLRDDFLRRIEKKKAEIEEMRIKLRIEERYLEAMNDTYKILPRDGAESNGSGQTGFHKGSGAEKAYLALKKAGRPLHVKDLVEATGGKVTRTSTQGLASSLRAYVNKGEIFTKPAPNTYGLVEFSEAAPESPDAKES